MYMIKCSINSNIRLEENPSEILIGHHSPREILEMLGLTENSNWSDLQGAFQEYFKDDLIDPESTFFGIQKLGGDSGLGFGYLQCWLKVGEEPKICFFLFMNPDGEIDGYVPRRGNIFNDDPDNELTEERLTKELGPIPAEIGLDKFLRLGLLDPDWEAAEGEFIAYQRYVY